MKVTRGVFENLDPAASPDHPLRIHVGGERFERRAAPLLARVGDVPVEQILIAPEGRGFSGLLATEPNPGDRLFVRYGDEPELDTDVVFGSMPIG